MKVSTKKRFLAWLIAFLMVVTYMPSVAYASGNDAVTDEATATVDLEAEESTEAESTEVSDDTQLDVADTPGEDVDDAAAPNEEAAAVDLEVEESKESESIEVSVDIKADTTKATVEETYDEIPVLGGDVLVYNSKGLATNDGDVVTITSPGKAEKPTANVIQVYNKTDVTATLTFDYEASNYKDFSEGTESGTFTKTLAKDEFATLSITGLEAYSNNTATIVLSNFNLEPVQETSEVTFTYEKSLGSVTVADKAVSSGDVVDATYDPGVSIIATPNDTVRFLGWINKDSNKIISKESTYTLKPVEDMTVEAVFADENSQPYFMAGDKYLFTDLTEAANKAKSLVDKTVVLMNDATLTGNHTIPAGVTFLIPFNDEHTAYKIATKDRTGIEGKIAGGIDPEGEKGSHVTPTVYRKLTMAEGSSITVNGDLSLSAKHHAAVTGSNGGSPTGAVSQIDMKAGSSITVNSKGALYAYGYITGNGNIDIKSGAFVFEYFQFEDWRGGSASLGIANDFEHGVFPMSQYYVQNIEVPLKLEAGASEWVYTSVNIGGTSIIGAPVEFMGSSDAMFNLQSGYVVKSYDGTTDRLNIVAEGTMNLSPIVAKMGSNSIPTEQHELPINSNITVKMKSGTDATITQDLALLPGSEIIIEDGATCTLADGVSVYAYDNDQWGGYCGTGNKKLVPINYAPSKTYTRTDRDLVDAKVQIDGHMDASVGSIYSTVSLDEDGNVVSGGANIYSNGTGVIETKSGQQMHTYQVSQTGTEGGFIDIRIFPALLTNKDGSTMQTWDFESAGTYTYINGQWVCGHAKAETIKTPATCTEPGVKKAVCKLDTGELNYHTYTYELPIPATGHKPESVVKTNAVAATCTENGNVAYWTCNDCNTMFLDKECTKKTNAEEVVVPMLTHDIKQHEAKEPTCTEIGWDAYVTCEREGCGYTTYEEKAALKHNTTHKAAVNNTCTTDGNEEYWYCERCKIYFKDADCTSKFDKEPVIKAAHDMEYFNETPATCTEAGQASGGKCKNCDYTVDAGVIEALGHIVVAHDAVPVSCTKDGCEAYWTCSREGCDMMFSDAACTTKIENLPVIKTNGHDTIHHEAAAVSCTKDGNDEYWACKACDKIFADAAYETELQAVPVIKSEGHKLTVTAAKAATCKEEGNKEYWTCSVCKKMYEDEDCDVEFIKVPVIDKLPHTERAIKAKSPTCTETGMTAGVDCSVCGEVLTAPVEVPSLGGHKWGKGNITSWPNVVVEQGTDKVIYTSGSRTFICENDGCNEPKEEALDWGTIKTYEDFIKNIEILEDWAFDYATANNIEDSAGLVIRYVRTGVDRYNSGSWQTMAGVDNLKFTKYVTEREVEVNDRAKSEDDKVNVTGLKNINNFYLPNGERVDFGHMFGTMDISYTNKTSINHADVAGFFGDTVDLLSTADGFEVSGTIMEMVKDITDNYFLVDNVNWDDKFGRTDMLGDLDGYYINRELISQDYEKGMLTDIMKAYFTETLTEKQRAQYYLENRLQCGTSKSAVRAAVYTAYTGNSVITTLEGTRKFNTKGDAFDDLRKAVCYTVADYICKLAGDYTADIKNECYTVNSEEFATLAPGITQECKTATMHLEQDGKMMDYNMQYFIVTSDVTRDDVKVWANYPTRPIEKDKDGNYVWSRMTVLNQAKTAQETYGNPESELYIENFNVIASTNADGFDMTGDDRGEPGGLLIMDGEEISPITANGFFGILEDGSAVIGTAAEYNNIYRGQLKEAIGAFGTTLVRDGKIVATSRGGLAPRTAVGITATGKVVMMVLDGRQTGGVSAGGDMLDIAHIMLEAGCVDAINLDGGGSSTFVAKQPGADEITLLNSPSDGHMRALGSSLMAISTAKSSTVFDKADIKAPTNYMTVGSEMQMTANGVTSTGNPVDIPEGATWEVSDKGIASIDAEGKLTALRTGKVYVNLVLDKVTVGQKLITVVIPNKITFTKPTIDAVYDSKVKLPIKAYYEGKNVTINGGDFDFVLSNEKAGEIEKGTLNFVAGPASTGLRAVDVTASVKGFEDITAKATIRLYNQGENTFDFDKKTGGDRTFAWMRSVSNSKTLDNSTYYAEDSKKVMETEYIFAIDMEQIPVPEVLEELTDMLPGHEEEGACAWTYLCNLAQRISDQSEVTATVKIDENFELVDWEKIEVKNEYFKPAKDGGVKYDKETNTLTLKLNWVRQYAPIEIEMANPLCLVNGIKLVPKKGADYNTINAINEGNISYKVYMRASSLYSFANDPKNQEKYGLLPYKFTYKDQNGIEQEEACGGFGATYVKFKDSYTLVSEKKGWTVEDGGWRYYKDGAPLKGINRIDEMVEGKLQSLYYDFGEDGIIKGNEKKTYSGLIVNEGVAGKKTYSYAIYGVLKNGWVRVGDDYYYFDPTTNLAVSGKKTMVITAAPDFAAGEGVAEPITETITYEFDETGKLKDGVWFTNDEGKIYYYFGPGFKCSGWGEKNGKKVYFAKKGYLVTGINYLKEDSRKIAMYYRFDKKTGELIQVCEGFTKYNGKTYYYATEEERTNGTYPTDTLLKGKVTGLQKINGKYYYFSEKSGAMYPSEAKTVKLSVASATYTGKVHKKPSVKVLDSKGNAMLTDYYTVKYASGFKNVGRYKVTVSFSGPYADNKTKTLYYAIVPKAPTSAAARLGTSSGGYDDAVISWSKATGASGYNVYYRKSTTSKYSYLGSTSKTSIAKKNLSDGAKYYFKIVPYYKSGSTKYMALKYKTTSLVTMKKIATPKVTKKGSYVKVSWKNIPGETGYQISKSKYKTKAGTVTTYKTTKGTYKNVKAAKGKKYYYMVRAFKDVKVGKNTVRVYAPWSKAKAYKR